MNKGELLTGGGGALLLAVLLLAPWFAVPAPGGRLEPGARVSASLDGWQALTTTRWVLLVAIAAAFALVLLTASQRAPALPVLGSVVSCLLGGLASLLLLYRIIDHPGLAARVGIYVGFVAAVAIGYGGYLALRTEGGWFGDPRSIATVSTRGAEPGSEGRGEPTSAGRPGR